MLLGCTTEKITGKREIFDEFPNAYAWECLRWTTQISKFISWLKKKKQLF